MLTLDHSHPHSGQTGIGIGMGRMGEMDQMVLSPPPSIQGTGGMMPEANWMAFGQVMPHSAPGTDSGFPGDPFGGHGHSHGHGQPQA
jgi:hypothetical protein